MRYLVPVVIGFAMLAGPALAYDPNNLLGGGGGWDSQPSSSGFTPSPRWVPDFGTDRFIQQTEADRRGFEIRQLEQRTRDMEFENQRLRIERDAEPRGRW